MNRFRLALAGLVATAVLVPMGAAAYADPGERADGSKVTICHRTRSTVNPYVRITVDRSAVDGTTKNGGSPHDDHSHHLGDPFDPGATYAPNAKIWGDIIPDAANGGVGEGLNWTERGQDIYFGRQGADGRSYAGLCGTGEGVVIPVGGIAGTVIALTAAGGYVVYRQRRRTGEELTVGV